MRRQRLGILLTIIFCSLLTPVQAQTTSLDMNQAAGVSDVATLAGLPVLDEGRVKPLESYARHVLLRLSGKRSYDRKPAVQWLARLLFAPETTRDDAVFLINNPEIPMAIGITPHKNRRYHFSELEPGLIKFEELANAAVAIEPKERSIVEAELVRVFANLVLYAELSRSFIFAIPHPDFQINDIALRKRLDFPGGQNRFSFLDIALQADELYELSQPLTKKTADDFSQSDQDVLKLMSQLYQWAQVYRDLPLHMVPTYPDAKTWVSPWDAVNRGLSTDAGRQEITQLRDVVQAYWQGDQMKFDSAVATFGQSIQKRVTQAGGEWPRLKLEQNYHHWNLFYRANVLYLLTLLLFLVSLFWDKTFLRLMALTLLAVAFAAHTGGIILRIIILARPPVSTLYETFVFVGWMCVLLGLIVERSHRHWLGIVTAAFGGFVFHMIATKFSADGDTLKVLVAVLNSNFWLGTHVLTVTIGYAGCVVAGIIGHIYLIYGMIRPTDRERLQVIYRNLIGALGFGLTMTFLGTTLGGIWADQSWGRFWGWDPKENGALLIVLWTAILFHARMGGLIRPLGMAVGSVLGVIVVMWAWFGVNLLSVGLHSYGFTSGVATWLFAFVGAEIIFVIFATFWLAKKGWRF